jgi:hypothetical protein
MRAAEMPLLWALSRRRVGAYECELRLLCRLFAGSSLGTAATSESPPSMEIFALCRYCVSMLERRREGHWTSNPVRLLTAK